jgi:uncharacterized membrane protein YqhA
MKRIFNLLKLVITAIALLVFAAGVILALLGVFEFFVTFSHLASVDKEHVVGMLATGLLKAIDLFLMAVVFFVFSIGILILFTGPDELLPVVLPEWLQIKKFVELKVILWEAILTSLVISYLSSLAEQRMAGKQLNIFHLIIPGVIFLISLSLFLLKKREK